VFLSGTSTYEDNEFLAPFWSKGFPDDEKEIEYEDPINPYQVCIYYIGIGGKERIITHTRLVLMIDGWRGWFVHGWDPSLSQPPIYT